MTGRRTPEGCPKCGEPYYPAEPKCSCRLGTAEANPRNDSTLTQAVNEVIKRWHAGGLAPGCSSTFVQALEDLRAARDVERERGRPDATLVSSPGNPARLPPCSTCGKFWADHTNAPCGERDQFNGGGAGRSVSDSGSTYRGSSVGSDVEGSPLAPNQEGSLRPAGVSEPAPEAPVVLTATPNASVATMPCLECRCPIPYDETRAHSRRQVCEECDDEPRVTPTPGVVPEYEEADEERCPAVLAGSSVRCERVYPHSDPHENVNVGATWRNDQSKHWCRHCRKYDVKSEDCPHNHDRTAPAPSKALPLPWQTTPQAAHRWLQKFAQLPDVAVHLSELLDETVMQTIKAVEAAQKAGIPWHAYDDTKPSATPSSRAATERYDADPEVTAMVRAWLAGVACSEDDEVADAAETLFALVSRSAPKGRPAQ